jgi:DNA-directed RNA polymerase subunit E'/Rpb7
MSSATTSSLFTKSIITDNVRLSCAQLTNQYKSYVKLYLQNKYEGKCSRYGYTRTGSIEILKVSTGTVRMFSLNGDAMFKVQFRAEICNPLVGQVMSAIVLNVNKFGVLASGGTFDGDVKDLESILPIVDIVIPKVGTITSGVDLSEIKPGDRVTVEILGKKFNINDPKISAIGSVKAIEFVSEGLSIGEDGSDGDAANDLTDIVEDALVEDDVEDEEDVVDVEDAEDEEDEEDEEDDDNPKIGGASGVIAAGGCRRRGGGAAGEEEDEEDDEEEGLDEEDDNNSVAASTTAGGGGFEIDSDEAFDEGAEDEDDDESEESEI